jgi:MFS family permease
MISGTYFTSAAVVIVLGFLLRSHSLTAWTFMAFVVVAFFFASAGASSAYLTVSEIFPMETRALAIALFYAVGTAIGGITGPLLFGHFIHSGDLNQVATGFFIGAGAMAVGGVAELLFGVRAEGRSLEGIAKPLTAMEAEAERAPTARREDLEPAASETAKRIRERAARVRRRERHGARRFRPGVGSSFYSPGMIGTAGTTSRYAAMAERDTDREVQAVQMALDERGALDEDQLEMTVHGAGWGPGRFRRSLRVAVDEGRAERLKRRRYGPARR